MYIKKQKELKTFLPTFIYLFADLTSEYCRSASYLVAPPQSCHSQNCEGILFGPVITILWLWLWSQALWSQSAECNSSFYVQSRRHPIITLWSSAFHQLEVAGVTKRCQKSVQWHIFDSTEHIVTWQMWQCAIKWQSDMCSVKAVIIWIWLEIFIPHSPNFPPKVSWNTLGQ